MKKYCITAAVLLFFQLHLHAQDLGQKISLQFRDVPLEALLQQVSKRYFISFSYGNHPLAMEKRISVAVAEMPLGEFLRLVLDSAGLTYKVMGGYVVLGKQEDKKAAPVEYRQLQGEKVPAQLPATDRENLLMQDSLPRVNTIPAAALGPMPVPEWQLPAWTVR